MKPVQMKPVLAEEVATVKNNPHQQRTHGLLLEPLQS
jgi:hypothetical protein